MSYLWAVASHQGRLRPVNQDSVHPSTAGRGEGPVVVMVADGMGGHAAGEVASQMAVEHALAVDGSVEERVLAANSAILEEATRKPELAGMGTTLTLVELGDDLVGRLAHVGDSRAYLLREGRLEQITEDHTVVRQYVASGKITAEEAVGHPHRSMLTRALGLTYRLEVDRDDVVFRAGDRLLLCSDGVSGMLSEAEIHEILQLGTPEEAVWGLVEAANRAGGHDNITALVVDVEP
ncbi:MAG: PP2C family serine/threonine-protein phosphatase [Acidimicrobiia bacterium]|jgi:PPM family protein phosphatase